MIYPLTTFVLFAGQGILGPWGIDAASLAPVLGMDFNPQTGTKQGTPPDSSSGQLVFNWHGTEDLGNHNAEEPPVFLLTDGGNSTLADNSTGSYVIEAMAVQFNDTHFKQAASTTPWIAVFPCTTNSSAGNTSDLITNAQELGAHAILAYTESATYSYCNLTDNTPPVTIPIYITEYWGKGATVFSDELHTLFSTSKITFYNAAAMNKLAANISSDFSALKADSAHLAQTEVVLARIPGIATNTSVVAATTTSSTTTPNASQTPSSAVRNAVQLPVALGLVVALLWKYYSAPHHITVPLLAVGKSKL
ncbi:hypothetical protein C8R43DRAFT_960368 [Mycena crocata]|nr:hypothetical protein C8R43DRAFT_960368 [Mycena crocata]